MKPMFWFVAGVGTTLYGAVKLRKATDFVTPEGRADRWAALTHGAHILAQDVRTAHHVRKVELRQRYGLTALATQHTPELETEPMESEPR